MRFLLGLLLFLTAAPAAAELLTPADLASLESVAAADARLAQGIAAAEAEQARLAGGLPALEASIDPLLPRLEAARALWQRVYDLNAPHLRNLRGERLPQDLQRMRDEIARARAPFDALLAEIQAIHDRIAAQRTEIARQEELALAQAEARLQLRAEADRRFVPPALVGLEIAWADAAPGAPPLYRAGWSWSGEDPERGPYIDWLFGVLREVEALQVDAARNALEAERAFRQISAAWQTLNREYIDQTTYTYFMDSVLAFGGVAIAVVGNLETWPAALLFELADTLREYKPWRAMGGSIDRRYEVPKLSEELIRLRQELAEGTPKPGSLDDLGSSSALVDPTKSAEFRGAQDAKFAEEMTWEGIKSGLEIVYGVMAESFAQGTLELSGLGEGGAFGRVLPALITGQLDSAEDYHRLYRLLGGDRFQTGAALLRGMALGSSSVGEELLERLQNGRQWADWAKGAAVGAGYEVVKQIALLKIDERRVQIYHAMASTEIRWFLLRNDYVAKMQLKRSLALVRRSVLQELGAALAERAEVCCERTLAIEAGRDLALPVAEVVRRGLAFRLVFDRPVDFARLTVSVPDVGDWPTLYSQTAEATLEHAMELRLPGTGSDDGTLPGALEALVLVAAGLDPVVGTDGEAATVAHLDPALALTNAEPGPDKTHRLRLIAPVLRILSPPPDPQMGAPFAEPCETMVVAFDAGRPLPPSGALDLVGIAPAGERRTLLGLGGQTKGQVTVTAPAEEGQYLLALTEDPARPEVLESRPLFVDRIGSAPPVTDCDQPGTALWETLHIGPNGQAGPAGRMESFGSGEEGEEAMIFFTAGKRLEEASVVIRCARAGIQFTCFSEVRMANCGGVRIPRTHRYLLTASPDGRLLEGSMTFLKFFDSSKCEAGDLEPGQLSDMQVRFTRLDE